MSDEAEFRGLPGILARIAEVAGIDAARKLSVDFGGTTVYVPERDKENALTRSIGAEAAAKIIRRFGSGHIDIPMARSWHLRETIEKMLRERKTVAEIARQLRCHQRTVYRVRRRMRALSRQDARRSA